ncbi:uncharacterized protein LOC141719312 [Apium graveolens]|uniref:uncharacterized protein LOC141719312 n=1 Tax=Apium graveolens TaxID=4045 RepID=UPI003D7A866A
MVTQTEVKPWTLYTDGASNMNGTGLGLVLKSPQEDTMVYSVYCEFKATNNEAEYEALIMGLMTAKDLDVKHIKVNCDSILIVNHINGTYDVKDIKMITYLDIVKSLSCSFESFHIQQIPREDNTQADALAGLGDQAKERFEEDLLCIVEIKALSIDVDTNQDEWLRVYENYFQHGTQLDNSNEARVLRMRASRFTMLDGVLFKKSASGVLQRFLRKSETDVVLRDLHKGECGNHANGRNLSLKLLRWDIIGQ